MYFLRSKSEVSEKFVEYKALVENQTGHKIKVFRSDNGTEYVNERLSSLLRRCGIKHETTVPYSPQQNGIAERLNRTLVERARSMLMESHLSVDLWAEAVATAVYLRNRSPTKALSAVTPQEAWRGHNPISVIFVSLVVVLLQRHQIHIVRNGMQNHKNSSSLVIVRKPKDTDWYIQLQRSSRDQEMLSSLSMNSQFLVIRMQIRFQ